MEWLERMRKAMDYMEDNMSSDIDIEELARIACCSTYHFQRMFSFITGVTLAEYIRRRRLTLAAVELQKGQDKIIDIAVKYGYDSPDAFTRAFHKLHGMTPSAAREPGVKLKAYPRISFQISLKGDKDMDYRIVEKPAFKVIGKGIRVSTKDGENYKRIPEFWGESYCSGFVNEVEQMAEKTTVTGEAKLGICIESTANKDELTYLIGVEKTSAEVPTGYIEREIPSLTWAIFESVGRLPDSIQELHKRIYSEWFPTTGYQRAASIDMEVLPPGDEDNENYRCEVWIPVVKE